MNSAELLRRHLCILDVGHGNSAVLIAGEEHVVVIDVGKQNVISEFLLQQGIEHIDSLYLSHAHEDHIAALQGILGTKQVSIDRIFVNGDGTTNTKVWDDLCYELDCANQEGSLEFSVGVSSGDSHELPGEVRVNVLV